MERRWRAPLMGLAIILAVAATVAVSGTRAPRSTASGMREPRSTASWLTVTGPEGALIARSPIEQGGAFVLRYRNSLYGSLAEERFVMQHGEMVLVGLAADEVAVLDEYYHTDRPARRSAGGGQRAWSAAPALQVRLRQLHVAATDLGQRTLLVPGQPAVELWRFVDDRSPTVTLSVEGGSG